MKQILYFVLLVALLGCQDKVVSPRVVDKFPDIYPDYTFVTVPENIAALNFTFKNQSFELIDVVIEGKAGKTIHVQGDEYIQLPDDEWKQILSYNKGCALNVTVALKQEGKWNLYRSFKIYVSKYSMDERLVYRLIAPGYEVYSKMGIYQRDLTSFNQTPIVENTLIPGTCVNCHSFNQNNPKMMSLHVRGAQSGTMIMRNGQMNVLNTKTDSTMSPCVYPYWHPSGRYIAYSVNQTKQAFHEVCHERVEVFDAASDVMVLDLNNNKLISCHQLKTANLETFPVFSPDGKSLYFCAAKKRDIQTGYKEIKYSLCKIDFDASSGTFGNQVDTLVSASVTKKSISFPRPSFDGKYIMFTMSDYGNFSIWHKEADLFLYDVKKHTYRAINEVNSKNTESFHDWSSNSHWFVFSSRRGDGLYTRPYFSSIDENGVATKPFLLPQKDPRVYDHQLTSFNIPEFTTSEVEVNLSEFESKMSSTDKAKLMFNCQK